MENKQRRLFGNWFALRIAVAIFWLSMAPVAWLNGSPPGAAMSVVAAGAFLMERGSPWLSLQRGTIDAIGRLMVAVGMIATVMLLGVQMFQI